MTRHEIFLNYSQAMKQADRLDEVAQRIEKLVGETIERTTDALKAQHQGLQMHIRGLFFFRLQNTGQNYPKPGKGKAQHQIA